jgi:hypothetical protein
MVSRSTEINEDKRYGGTIGKVKVEEEKIVSETFGNIAGTSPHQMMI